MNKIPFRIKIGVTGHRKDLPDVTDLKNKLKEVLGIGNLPNYRKTIPNSLYNLFDTRSKKILLKARKTEIAFNVLTALAEGADRIVAEVILETEDSKLEAVIPLTQDDYFKDFTYDASITEFNNLLNKDQSPICLRNKNVEEEYDPSLSAISKNNAYFDAGEYIVNNCDVLVVIWDQKQSTEKGGTYDVMEYAKKVEKPVIIIDSKNIKNIKIIKGIGLNNTALKQINRFNTYKVSQLALNKEIEKEDYDIFNPVKFKELSSFDDNEIDFLKKHLTPDYAKASILANLYKNWFIKTGQVTYLCTTLAVTVLITSILFNVLEEQAYFIEFILLSFIFILISIAHKERVHSSWLEFRFLTERLRATTYFFLAQVEILGTKPPSNGGSAINKKKGAIMIFSEIWNQLNQINGPALTKTKRVFNSEIINFVRKSWIDSQMTFQENYFIKNNRINNIFEKGGRLIFASAILCALAHLLISFFSVTSYHLLETVLTFLALTLPTIAATFEGLRRQGEYSRNRNRSEGLKLSLHAISKKFQKITQEDEFNALLRETDIIMLSETKEWMMLMIPSELDYIC